MTKMLRKNSAMNLSMAAQVCYCACSPICTCTCSCTSAGSTKPFAGEQTAPLNNMDNQNAPIADITRGIRS